ncbi:MAG: PIN domain-containing protein [Bryobacteraceae bacterium]|nr:PIN domain-containing protein [Bryobacteraceae bacterium]
MKILLLDTNIVSILFKPDHSLHRRCLEIAVGHQWFISFMTHSELLLWPRVNQWKPARRQELTRHIDLCTTLLATEETCAVWADIMAESRTLGRPVTAADAWVAAAARQWDLPLVTADYRDFEHLKDLTLLPV